MKRKANIQDKLSSVNHATIQAFLVAAFNKLGYEGGWQFTINRYDNDAHCLSLLGEACITIYPTVLTQETDYLEKVLAVVLNQNTNAEEVKSVLWELRRKRFVYAPSLANKLEVNLANEGDVDCMKHVVYREFAWKDQYEKICHFRQMGYGEELLQHLRDDVKEHIELVSAVESGDEAACKQMARLSMNENTGYDSKEIYSQLLVRESALDYRPFSALLFLEVQERGIGTKWSAFKNGLDWLDCMAKAHYFSDLARKNAHDRQNMEMACCFYLLAILQGFHTAKQECYDLLMEKDEQGNPYDAIRAKAIINS